MLEKHENEKWDRVGIRFGGQEMIPSHTSKKLIQIQFDFRVDVSSFCWPYDHVVLIFFFFKKNCSDPALAVLSLDAILLSISIAT